MRDKKLALHSLLLALMVIVLDQASKWWVLEAIQPDDPVEVTPFFNLVLTFNAGAAFSFLGTAGGWQRYFLGAIAIIISVWLVWMIWTARGRRLQSASLALILGGALGNVIDRFRLGAVVDFIDIHIGTVHWPAFNIADIGITVGVILLLLDAFSGRKRA